MVIELEKFFNVEGSHEDFDFSFQPEYPLSDDFESTGQISFSGSISNSAGLVNLTGKAKFTAEIVCSRCAETFEKEFVTDIEHQLVSELNDEDNDVFLLIEDMQLDLDSLICEDIILSLPYVFLCREDCKGICSQCGKNLNEGPCNCKKAKDPRMAALLQLLDE